MPRARRAILGVGALAAVVLAVAAGYVIGGRATPPGLPSFERVTFRRGNVGTARFTSDGQSVLYNARWMNGARGIWAQRLSSPDARLVAAESTGSLMAITGGEMIVARRGTIARLPLDGGTPRDIADSVHAADWSQDGSRSVIVRRTGSGFRIESPIGRTILTSVGDEAFGQPRLAPRGDRIAFIDRGSGIADPYQGDIKVVDFGGRVRVLSRDWRDVLGLAWSADGKEVWFTGCRTGRFRQLHAVDLAGHERLVMRTPGDWMLCDIAPDGRVLLTHAGLDALELRGRMAGDAAERDLSWLDGSCEMNLAPEGDRMIFQEELAGGGDSAAVYLRIMDGSPPVRIAHGRIGTVSPDWKWALCYSASPATQYRLVPLGAGETIPLPRGHIVEYSGTPVWQREGNRILLVGREAGQPLRLYGQVPPDGAPRALGPTGIQWGSVLSADGRAMTGRPMGSDQPWSFYPIDGGEPRPIPGLARGDRPLVASEDGRGLFIHASGSTTYPIRVVRLDLRSGAREPWLELTPPSLDGVMGAEVRITPDGRSYAYRYQRQYKDLYVVTGLR